MCSIKKEVKLLSVIILLIITSGLCIADIDIDEQANINNAIIANGIDLGADNKIMKRTPQIDGEIVIGEWDVFYEYGDNKIYSNWDNNNIYFAGAIDKDSTAIIIIDTENSGWFHGEDNYEFIVSNNLIGKRYISPKGSIGEPTEISQSELELIDFKHSESENISFELAIPSKLIRKLDLRNNKKIGLNILILNTDSVSNLRYERNTLEAEFVDRKMASLDPLEVKIELRDNIIARGEEIQGKFTLKNNGTNPIDIDSVIMSGEGRTAPFINSQKIVLEPIDSKKSWSRNYSSIIPTNMPTGTWVIGAEARHESNRLGGAIISFDVVDPYQMSLKLPTTPIGINTKQLDISLLVRNNTKDSIRGRVTITLPLGWEIHRSNPEREFRTARRSVTEIKYRIVPPLGATGNIPVGARVAIGNYEEEISGYFEVAGSISQ